MINITEKEAFKLITTQTKGHIFSANIVKKDGKERLMNCKLSVNSLKKGGELSFDPTALNMIPVVDVNLFAYRMINVSTVRSLQINKQFYNVEHE